MIHMATFGAAAPCMTSSTPSKSLHSFPYGSSQQSNTVVMIHDAFQPLSYWNNFLPAPQWQGVAMDTHIYQVFSNAVRSIPC
jgi:hypothetical protein